MKNACIHLRALQTFEVSQVAALTERYLTWTSKKRKGFLFLQERRVEVSLKEQLGGPGKVNGR